MAGIFVSTVSITARCFSFLRVAARGAILFGVIHSAAAQTTGDNLFSWCAHQGPYLDVCTGYIRGVVEVAMDLRKVCLPPQGLTMKETTDIVISYLGAKPNARGLPARQIVIAAMSQAFPCDK